MKTRAKLDSYGRERFYVSASAEVYAKIAQAARARGISPRKLVELALVGVGK